MTKPKDLQSGITAARLRSVLHYCSDSGVFRWLVPRRNAPAGEIAGWRTASGQIGIQVDGSRVLAHRLAWLYVYGAWPEGIVDHINGDCSDNRVCNLRVVSASQNQWNRGKPRNNKSSFKGVSWRPRRRKWYAAICVAGVTKHLGSFDTAESASAAYQAAATLHHGPFGRAD